MKVILSHSYNKKNKYFLVEKDGESLEKIFLKLAVLLTIIFHLNTPFSLEEEEIAKLLKIKLDFKTYKYNELWKKYKIIDVNFSNFFTLFENQSEDIIYHVDLYYFWDFYFYNKRDFKRVYKELKNNKKFYKQIHTELILTLKNQYLESYKSQIKDL